jgi:hypothetical protein
MNLAHTTVHMYIHIVYTKGTHYPTSTPQNYREHATSKGDLNAPIGHTVHRSGQIPPNLQYLTHNTRLAKFGF